MIHYPAIQNTDKQSPIHFWGMKGLLNSISKLYRVHLSRVSFAVHGLYIFVLPTRCLRLAYAVAVFSYAGTICLDLPTRAYAYQLFSDFAYAACVCCFCGLSVGLNSSHFAYAVGASVVSWGCVFCTSGRHFSYHNNKTQLAISQQNTSSNTAYAEKNINQHPPNAYEKPTRASEMPTPALHKTYFV